MTKRERTMATVLGGGAVFAVGFFGFLMFYNAYVTADQAIDRLKKEVEESQAKLVQVKKDTVKLQRWRRLSLGSNLEEDRVAYRDYLTDKLRRWGLMTNYSFETPPADTRSNVQYPGKKVPIYTGISFYVRFKAKLSNLVNFVQDFQNEPKMHRIKAMSIERTDDKKDDMLQVNMTFEALAILDADKAMKDKKYMPDSSVLKWEMKSFLAGAPSGIAMLSWSLGPNTIRLDPLNAPQTGNRKYGEVTYRNPFVGFFEVKGSGTGKGSGPPPKDDKINMMRFDRLVSLIDEDGNSEAWLWDIYHNDKIRLKNKSGFNTFPLVRTDGGQSGTSTAVVYGKVVKIEEYNLIFRVCLKPAFGASYKWWRYPDTNNFFTLHKDDLDWLIHKEEKATEADKGNLYLVNSTFWEKLTRKDKGKIEVYRDGKSFRIVGEGSYGKIIWSDSKVVIIHMEAWPPTSAPHGPSIAATKLYPEVNAVYAIDSKHFDDLVTRKLAKKGEVDRVYVMRKDFYDILRQQKVITGGGGGGKGNTFSFYKDLIYCDVLSEASDVVVFRTAEQYCRCPPNADAKTDERWHEGFCVLPLHWFVQEALTTPVSITRTKELLKELGNP